MTKDHSNNINRFENPNLSLNNALHATDSPQSNTATIIRVVTDSSIYISRSVSIECMQSNYCVYYVNTAAILKINL